MSNPVIIFGAGGLGRAAQEIFESNGTVVYGFLDDRPELHHTEIDHVLVLGGTEDDQFLKLIGKKCDGFVASDDNKEKSSLTNMIKDERKVMPANAVHQSAQISRSAKIGHGNFINARVAIGAGTDVANHCLFNIGSTIDYNVTVGDFVQIGAGATIASNVVISENAFIGAGATIIPGIKIGKNARIGAGSVVVADVENGKTVFGNPAQVIK